MLEVKDITYSINSKIILNNISFKLNHGNKIGLIGSNGVGKSTLLKIIIGELQQEEGNVFKAKETLIGYFKQEMEILDTSKTVSEYIKDHVGIIDIENEMSKLEENLNVPENLEKYSQLQEVYLALDGYNFEYKISTMLNGIGICESRKNDTIQNLSGGQKSKVMLIAVLLKGADLLLLDEPTNNLDINALKWLEDYLSKVDVPLMMVSHDRVFLDKIINKVIYIDYFTRKAIEYKGNFSNYLEVMQSKYDTDLKLFEEQQEEISKIKKDIKQKKGWAIAGRFQNVKDNDKYTKGYERDRASSLAKAAKSSEKKLEQMQKYERPKQLSKLKINISADEKEGNCSIFLKDLSCGYDYSILDNINYAIEMGKKVVIIGENGSGKTTLIKTIIGILKPIDGEVIIGSGIKLAYMSQESEKNDTRTLKAYMLSKVKEDLGKIFTVLSKFGIDYEDRDKHITKFSPGQRLRIELSVFSLLNINTLILDEPTNHLDLDCLEALENVISEFEGIIIVITHDRRFISKLGNAEILKIQDCNLISIDDKEVY
ncbi:MAG: ABC-F family ATP-binding cassette domain-containing protein [Clostridia bacterium]|nr:ABC-F family ATP-binding cassette domain-containing protein [Clostridia bacterium]MDD4387101.1 ABC-F family ATP-binding cassette domain-containing protein [Clostridia bacterium]